MFVFLLIFAIVVIEFKVAFEYIDPGYGCAWYRDHRCGVVGRHFGLG